MIVEGVEHKKRPVKKTWTEIFCDTEEEFNSIQSFEFIKPYLLNGLEKMVDQNLMSLILLQINCSYRYDPFFVTVQREEIEPSITKLMDSYLDNEDYEECSRLDKVLKKLEKKKKEILESSGNGQTKIVS